MNIRDPRIGLILSIISIGMVLFVSISIWYLVDQIPQEQLDMPMDITYGEFFELVFYIMLIVVTLSVVLIGSTDEIIDYLKKRFKNGR